MSKKTTVLSIAAAIVLVAASARPGQAQARPDARPIRFYFDLGYVNLFDYPKWVNLGPELELRLGRLFTINPELSFWFDQSFRGTVNVIPGATANLRLGRFYVGGGAIRRVSNWAESASGGLLPKVQAGYLYGPTRLSLSLLYLNQTHDVVLGMTIGIGIGGRPRD